MFLETIRKKKVMISNKYFRYLYCFIITSSVVADVNASEKHPAHYAYVPYSRMLAIQKIVNQEPLEWLRLPCTRLSYRGITVNNTPEKLLLLKSEKSQLNNCVLSALIAGRKRSRTRGLFKIQPQQTSNK